MPERMTPTQLYLACKEQINNVTRMRRLVRQIIEHDDAKPEDVLNATDMQYRSVKSVKATLDSALKYFDHIHDQRLWRGLGNYRKEHGV
jgi:hypothetical protein